VVGSYPCCHWMKRPGSYSRNLPEPGHFHAMLREVLDIVDEHVTPGPVRDRYYAHWYRGKILKRFGEDGFLEAPADYRREYYDEARRLAGERFGAGVDRVLPVRMRVRSALLRADAYDALFRLVEAERGMRVEAVLDGVRWRGERLALRFTARFVYADGTPLAFADGRWEPPVPVDAPPEAFEIGDRPWRLDLYLRRRGDKADTPLDIQAERRPDGAMTGEAVIDTAALPWLPGDVWDPVARIDGGGWTYERRLAGWAEKVPARGRLEPYRTVNGNLSVRVYEGKAPGPLRRAARWLPGARRARA
jgi:poly(ribitol-phosphate) beta-N-acetylglucosaminyltransferase